MRLVDNPSAISHLLLLLKFQIKRINITQYLLDLALAHAVRNKAEWIGNIVFPVTDLSSCTVG